MIFDKIEHLNKYFFSEEFIKTINCNIDFTQGKFEIDRDKCFGIGLEYQTQHADDGLWEAHRKYLDVHILLEGEEMVSIADISNAISTKGYVDDYELFAVSPEQRLHLKPGYFLVLFPHEVHRTSEIASASTLVRKFVFKYLLDE